jgi:hypothetical protein
MLSPFCWWVKLHPSPDPRYQRATDEAQAYEHQTDGPIGVEPEGQGRRNAGHEGHADGEDRRGFATVGDSVFLARID